MVNTLLNLIIAIAVLIAAWFIIERFSPDPLITKICQIILFVIALVVILKMLLPLAGVGV
jgi:hypothetical protein